MAFEVKITPEDVDQLVKDTILKAGLGNFIEKVIKEVLTPSSYNNPITEKVRAYVAEICDELIREKYHDQIKEAIRIAVEEKVTPEIINLTVNNAMQRIIKAAEDRY